jgi:4-hydroxy-3-methylbut-2-enyl diphosphate reductase IspH
MPSAKRPIRIGGASGGFTDRQRAMHDLAKNADVDVIVGGMSACPSTGDMKAQSNGQQTG